jgi:hypothetical protein
LCENHDKNKKNGNNVFYESKESTDTHLNANQEEEGQQCLLGK